MTGLKKPINIKRRNYKKDTWLGIVDKILKAKYIWSENNKLNLEEAMKIHQGKNLYKMAQRKLGDSYTLMTDIQVLRFHIQLFYFLSIIIIIFSIQLPFPKLPYTILTGVLKFLCPIFIVQIPEQFYLYHLSAFTLFVNFIYSFTSSKVISSIYSSFVVTKHHLSLNLIYKLFSVVLMSRASFVSKHFYIISLVVYIFVFFPRFSPSNIPSISSFTTIFISSFHHRLLFLSFSPTFITPHTSFAIYRISCFIRVNFPSEEFFRSYRSLI